MMTNEQIEKIIDGWANEIDLTVEQLKVRLEQIMDKYHAEGQEVSYRQALKDLKRSLESEFGRGAMDLPQYMGFFVGIGRLVDWMHIRREKAKSVYAEDPERARLLKYTDREGRPLDNRKELFGRDNPHYGDLLDPDYDPDKPDPSKLRHEYQRSLYGIFKLVNVPDDWKFYEFRVRGEQAKGIQVKIATPCKFRCSSFQTKTGNTVLQPTAATRFFQLESLPGIEDFMQIFYEKIELMPLSELRPFFEARRNTYDRLVFVEGEVGVKRGYGEGDTFIGLTTADMDLNLDANVSCFVPAHIPTDFGIGSVIIVFGEVAEGRDGNLTISTYGVFPRHVVRDIQEYQASEGIAWHD